MQRRLERPKFKNGAPRAEVRCSPPLHDNGGCNAWLAVNMLSQADSLVELLNHLHTAGTIKLTKDPSIHPHGISRIDVVDPDAFRRSPRAVPVRCLPLSPTSAAAPQGAALLVQARGHRRRRRRARAAHPQPRAGEQRQPGVPPVPAPPISQPPTHPPLRSPQRARRNLPPPPSSP